MDLLASDMLYDISFATTKLDDSVSFDPFWPSAQEPLFVKVDLRHLRAHYLIGYCYCCC